MHLHAMPAVLRKLTHEEWYCGTGASASPRNGQRASAGWGCGYLHAACAFSKYAIL